MGQTDNASYSQPAAADAAAAFDAQQLALVAELAQLILPATDTPGAIEAGVPAFVQAMVCASFSPGERRLFVAGLRELDDDAQRRYKRAFAHCTPEQKQLLVRQLESAAARTTTTLLDPLDQQRLSFFLVLKDLVVVGYFSSEVGSTQALRPQPETGTYVGDYAIDANHRAWS